MQEDKLSACNIHINIMYIMHSFSFLKDSYTHVSSHVFGTVFFLKKFIIREKMLGNTLN